MKPPEILRYIQNSHLNIPLTFFFNIHKTVKIDNILIFYLNAFAIHMKLFSFNIPIRKTGNNLILLEDRRKNYAFINEQLKLQTVTFPIMSVRIH